MNRNNFLITLLYTLYQLIAVGTWVYLTLFDDYIYTWWNWIIVLPLNAIQAELWPITWIIRALLGG